MQSTIGMDHNLLGVKLVGGFHLETQFGLCVSRQLKETYFPVVWVKKSNGLNA
jgi:hypothetical protein